MATGLGGGSMPIRRRRRAQPPLSESKGLIPDPNDPKVLTAVYLSPDHKHLAVVAGLDKLAVYRLDGERLGERLSEHSIYGLPRVAWSNSGTKLAFVGRTMAKMLDLA